MTASRIRKDQSVMHQLLVKRIREEMGSVSENAFCKRPGAPAQKTFNEIMHGSDPRLSTLLQIAAALNMPLWQLLLEKSDVLRFMMNSSAPFANSTTAVDKLPGYPKIGKDFHEVKQGKVAQRKVR